MTVRLLALATLMIFSTTFFLALVILEEPPAIVGFILGMCNGSGWIGIIALWLRRCERS